MHRATDVPRRPRIDGSVCHGAGARRGGRPPPASTSVGIPTRGARSGGGGLAGAVGSAPDKRLFTVHCRPRGQVPAPGVGEQPPRPVLQVPPRQAPAEGAGGAGGRTIAGSQLLWRYLLCPDRPGPVPVAGAALAPLFMGFTRWPMENGTGKWGIQAPNLLLLWLTALSIRSGPAEARGLTRCKTGVKKRRMGPLLRLHLIAGLQPPHRWKLPPNLAVSSASLS